jgi:DNA repair exonuclease SbcCD ATPase subunit
MKKTLALSLLIPFALVCSCQKQDSTAEQQLAQRKTELAAREKALDEREKALEERENALAERQKLVVKPRVAPVPRTTPAEPQRTVPPELTGLMADPNQGRAEREQRMQERLAERQRKMEEIQRMRVPAVRRQATAPVTDQADSPSPSPTPE